jgi:hypothetical protein
VTDHKVLVGILRLNVGDSAKELGVAVEPVKPATS